MMDALVQTIDTAVAQSDFASLQRVFTEGWTSIGQGEQRSLSAHFIQTIVNNKDCLPRAVTNPDMEAVFLSALNHLPAVVPNAADNVLRQALFDAKIAGESPDYKGAAEILSAMRMEADNSSNSVYYMPAANRADVYVKIAECYLVEDEIGASETFVTRAGGNLPADAPVALVLRYKSTYARVLDANRKFLAAAQKYHELCTFNSNNNNNDGNHDSNGDTAAADSSATTPTLSSIQLDQDEVLELLGKAATCAILAPHGPQRARVLDHIASDPNLPLLDGLTAYQSHRRILIRMQRKQIIAPLQVNKDLEQLQSNLAEHQMAVMGDGLTILARGIMDHNLSAVSHWYKSIYIDTLATILGVSRDKAQETILERILNGSLQATMDEVDGHVTFVQPKSDAQVWDDAIASACQELSVVAEQVVTAAATTTTTATNGKRPAVQAAH